MRFEFTIGVAAWGRPKRAVKGWGASCKGAGMPDGSRQLDSSLTTALESFQFTCCGNERDEEVVKAVTDMLWEAGKRPLVSHASATKRRREEGVEVSRAVKCLHKAELQAIVDAGRAAVQPGEASSDESDQSIVLDPATAGDQKHMRRLHKEYRKPMHLHADVVRSAIQANVVSGEVQALPLYKSRRTKGQHTKAASSARAGVAAWLNSAEGQRWATAQRSVGCLAGSSTD